MRIVLFYHSLVSDWNHGNAHFLRGVAAELVDRECEVDIYEPIDGWSRANLKQEYGAAPEQEFAQRFPELQSIFYNESTLNLDEALDDADLVIVHEWNSHALVRRIGEHRIRHGNYQLLFHDTHHRAVTDPDGMSAYDLSGFDGVLAYGAALREIYLKRGWARRAWTWHEAADTRVFRPLPRTESAGDVVWIGNWGDDERTAELSEFLFDPVRDLGIKARVYGVRYPASALSQLAEHGIAYGGWLPNHRVPEVFANFRVTVHVPRRPYVQSLPGIPTIRPFEAMACGIPLVSAPWDDVEGLFTPGKDFLVARNGDEMRRHLHSVLTNRVLAAELKLRGLQAILSRHTCSHRVEELFAIYGDLTAGSKIHAAHAAHLVS